jgi:hypothetical protein
LVRAVRYGDYQDGVRRLLDYERRNSADNGFIYFEM